MTRVALIAVVVAAGLAGSPVRAQDPAQDSAPPWLASLSSYLERVRDHKPGALDLAARLTGFMSESELDELRTDFLALVPLCRRETGRRGGPKSILYRRTEIEFDDLRQVLGLDDEELARGDASRVLRRAAVLHADVAMLVIPLVPGQVGCSSHATLLVRDGNRIGLGCIISHWVHARLLLDAVTPDPSKDGFVRAWYVAVATYLLETGNYANASPHLEHARLLFRSDPEVLFERGYYQEAYASPLIQSVAAESGASPRSEKSYLEEAEGFYRRAISGNPGFAEARVRHGHVLARLGRYREAAAELRAARPAALGRELRYYAELFLGWAEESAGNAAAARGHYAQASALYPGAQSPLLALALLARRLGDRVGAQDAMRQMHALPATRGAADDPWSNYYRWRNADYRSRFAALHARLVEEEAR